LGNCVKIAPFACPARCACNDKEGEIEHFFCPPTIQRSASVQIAVIFCNGTFTGDVDMRTKVGHYDVVCELGRGGMGVVYKGFEAPLNRYVAIKTLSESLSHDESVKERFLREARSMAQLNDAHIIQIYFIGEEDGQPYFAMEFVEGESLSSFLKREGKMTPDQAAKVIHQTALGLAIAHDKGVVHRDIKPANLMLTTRGTIKIADFGIALAQHDFSKKLTATGEFVGTPGYLSPEVCLAKPMDLRSDIFSLGIVMFEMLTGRMPFTDESPLGLLLEVVRAEVPDVRQLNGEVDSELARILTRMVAKEPADRYQSCHELAEDLQRHPAIQKGGPITARAKLPAAASTMIGSLPTPAALSRATPPLPMSSLPTPAPAAHSAPATQGYSPTPATAQRALPSQPAPAAVPEAPRASVLARPDQRSKSYALPIAAAIALAVLGGGVFAFRDRIPGLGGTSVADTATATPTTLVDSSTAPTTPPVPGNDDGNPESNPDYSAGDAGDATHTGIAGADDGESIDDPSATPGLQALHDLAQSRKAVERDNLGGASDNGAIAQAAPETEAPRAGQRVAERIAERVAVARANPPTPPRPVGPPKVMVIGVGDLGITAAAEQLLEQQLEERGFLLADEDTIPGMNAILDSGRPDVPRLLGMLARANNIRAVTVVNAQPTGSSQLEFYGQYETVFSANLSVKTYDVQSRGGIGSGISTKVTFSNLNADEKAREAIEESLSRYLGSMSPYRPGGSGG
jgi:serine/threonine protein kinase